ncbi:DNA mismatch repair protein MutS2 [Balneicella halophila]|uniref:Endonuclease MutS2 n=2 Tax=Balneicella halophila TaxID=1537566 RepID=A0A7L4UQL0_BALHA|nr:DNA mismatch repair protein MutS2 [Balneicella halophila]
MVNYPDSFEEKIHFDKVKILIKEQALSPMGKELVDEMAFIDDVSFLGNLLGKVADMKALLDEGQEFPVSYYIDLRPYLQKIRVSGTFLELSQLFDFKRSIETISSVVSFISKQEEDKCLYLKKMLGEHNHTYPYVRERLNNILTKSGKIKDNASPELRKIRNSLLGKQQSVSKVVSRLLQGAKEQGWAPAETEVSVRDGRLVVPVNAAYKRKMSGIVHDESATGKTSYVEPAEAVELNNEIRELEYAERREILRILVAFAEDIRPYLDDLMLSYNFLAEIDFIRAKALFAQTTESIRPHIEDQPLVQWKQARHPLLYLHFKKEKKQLVPLDITINENQRILLISGPNAGGKSICLKTVGLLQYMLQCGLFIPLNEGSKCGLFQKMFIDIGDEQSIDDDLSTYSSHLSNMKYFTKNANAKTLLLIDEFGTGTEPLLGGAIAESVLEELNKKKAFGLITTHYTNLKHYASENEGIVNGAMLYDTVAMTPMYKLEIGTPGSSFAFEIARKIGLSEKILIQAKEKIGEDRVNFDSHLRKVVKDKMIWEKKRFKMSQQEKTLERVLANYKKELEELKQLKKKEISKAKEEANQLLSEANKTIEKTIKTITENKANKSVTRTIRDKFEKEKERLLKEEEKDASIDQKIRKIKEREERKKNRKSKERSSSKITERKEKSIEVGGQVKVTKTGAIGEVLEISGEDVVIVIGSLKMHTKKKDLLPLSNNKAKRQSSNSNSSIQRKVFDKRLSFDPDIDVRGERGVDAVAKVSEHIDNALMLGVSRVRILHGTGHGVLRKMIREYLATLPDVDRYKDEHIDHGGSGITVVEL